MILIKFVRNILNFFDYFNKKIIKLIKKKVRINPIIIDVGAHNGETIKIFKKKI